MKTGWRKRWRPAGGWQLLIVVLASTFVLGMAATISYYYAVQPAHTKVIIPPPLTGTRTIRAPTPHASTRFVTEQPVIVRPRPAVSTPRPILTTHPPPSSGSAVIPGTTPYTPYTPAPSTTEVIPPPSTDNPTPGVLVPSSTDSPSQGGPGGF